MSIVEGILLTAVIVLIAACCIYAIRKSGRG